MKINFKFLSVLSSAGVNLVAANCDLNDLDKADHWNAWVDRDGDPFPGKFVINSINLL